MESFICPICQKAAEDQRSVGVYCFYKVSEVAPKTKEKPFLFEVDPDTAYLAVTRNYPEGTRDKFHSEEIAPNSYKLHREQVKTPGIRVMERDMYTIPCCKECRAEFLELFAEWTEGKFVGERE